MRKVKDFWRPEIGIFLGLWLFLMVVGRMALLRDPGTFWHTKVGELLLSSGHLIRTDPFSFTFAGQPWIPQQWLGECIMAAIHRETGLDGLLLATSTSSAGLYAWLASRFLGAGLRWPVASVLVGLVVAVSAVHLHVRPHIATIIFMALTVAILCDFEAGRIRQGTLVWLVPIYVFWTNVHGGMLGGLATMALAVTGWVSLRLVGRDSRLKSGMGFVFLGGLLVACALTAFINPFGVALPGVWLKIMSQPLLHRIMQEHGPLRLFTPAGVGIAGWGIVLLALIYGIALAGVLPAWPRMTWLLPLPWLYLAFAHVRHVPLFAVTAGVVLADLFPQTRWADWLGRNRPHLFQSPIRRMEFNSPDPQKPRWRGLLLPAALVSSAIALQAAKVSFPILGRGWARLDPTHWPVALQEQLENYQYTLPGGTPIFNDMLYGGYLIYNAPGYRVFLDDRCELYGDRWLYDYLVARMQPTADQIRQWENQYGSFSFALVQSDEGFDKYFRFSPEWMVVQRTRTATLYRRR